MDSTKFEYTKVLKDGVCMSIEMWVINNYSNNALLQDNKMAEIGFIGWRPNYIAVVKIRINKLRNSRAYVETF